MFIRTVTVQAFLDMLLMLDEGLYLLVSKCAEIACEGREAQRLWNGGRSRPHVVVLKDLRRGVSMARLKLGDVHPSLVMGSGGGPDWAPAACSADAERRAVGEGPVV